METNHLHSEYVAGMRVEESFGKYRLSCKAGSYCIFGYDQVSNQSHRHNCYELCMVVSGNGSFIYGDTAYKIQKGDILLADPEVRHEIQAKAMENLVLIYFFIEIYQNRRLSAAGSFGERCIEAFLKGHIPQASQQHLLSYVTFIENYNAPQKVLQHGTYEALKNLILESLMSLADSGKTGNTAAEGNKVRNILENSMDYIDANLHRKFSVKDVAAYSCTSQRNLQYLFGKHLKKTVIDYINEKKMDLACHYLAMHFSIADAANMVGIGNASHFSTLFKKYKRVPPGKYQQSSMGERNGMGRRL